MLKNIYWFLFLASATFSSCNEYNKLMKSDDLQLKFDKAIEFYENEEYGKAYPLLEELIVIYRGTTKSELLSYYLCNCDFYSKDYSLAAFRYKNFANTFPSSNYVEECKFKSAQCLYLNSPKYSLDQTDTYMALDELRLFATQFANSPYVDSCNVLIDELRAKLERKGFENARQFYRTRNYKSAIVSFDNLLEDFPGSTYKEEALYTRFLATYYLALNSVSSKKMTRIEDSIKSYIKFVDSFSQSSNLKEVEALYETLLKEKDKLIANKLSDNGL